MNKFLHAIKAEWITGRRTFLRYSPLLFAILPLGLSIPAELFLINMNHASFVENIVSQHISINIGIWIAMVLPIYCILTALRNFYPEHAQRLWKHMNVQPISGSVQILAKYFYSWRYVAIATIIFFALVVLGLFIIKYTYPNLNIQFNNSILWWVYCKTAVICLVTGVSIVSILNLLSARFPGFTITFIIGFTGMFMPSFTIIPTFIPWKIGEAYHQYYWTKNQFNIIPEPWWIIVLFVWIAASLAIQLAVQRKKPLY